MGKTIQAAQAMLRVLEDWGVKNLYGIPGGSFNSTMDAFCGSQGGVNYIQVRHEEAGALAASCEAKLTGRVAACFGSAGPGATHLFNGLYDAQMDHAPVLALVGQVASTSMNYTAFQELNEDPMFSDVSVYNRTVMNPESLPHVVDEALRQAWAENGVAVVTIPVDYGFVEIPDTFVSTAAQRRNALLVPDQKDIDEAVKLIAQAERPVLYFGRGAAEAAPELIEASRKLSMPLISTVMAKGIVPDSLESYMGTAGRVASKPGNETLALTDLILFVGSDFPFAKGFFPPEAKFIQIDIDQNKMGRRHKTDVAILGDSKLALRQILDKVGQKEPSAFYSACIKNKQNWLKWLWSFADDQEQPLRPETIFKEVKRIAKPGAIFVTDVGNVTIHAVRMLDLDGESQKFTTSGWFATMGYAVPGAIGAQLQYPERQVFSLSGDGGFSMVVQELITQVRYKLPIINIVMSNDSLGFIEAEQEDTNHGKFGVDLTDADYGKVAEGLGALGFTVRRYEDLAPAFDAAAKCDRPVLIDVKIVNKRPLPVESLKLDEDKYSLEEIEEFRNYYQIKDMPTLKQLLKG